MANKTLTVTEAALELDTDSKTLRKFLRSITPADNRPGKGARWAIARKDLTVLRTKYTEYLERKATVVSVNFDGDALNEDAAPVPAVLQGVSLTKG